MGSGRVGTWDRGNVGTDGPHARDDSSNHSSIRSFEDLHVWQTARQLVKALYRAAESQRLGSDYAFLNQMRRSALSVGSNIAEGYERGSRKQQIEACFIAKGSAGEFRSQVIMAHDVGLIDEECFAWFSEQCDKCSRQLSRYIEHLRKSAGRVQGLKHAKLKDKE